MSFKVVAVVGSARHGKDTFAEILLEEHGFKRISLADELKRDVARLWPYPEYQVEFDERGRISSPHADALMDSNLKDRRRTTWQRFGTEGRREIFPDFWVWRWAFLAVRSAVDGWPGVVVADLRFPNEERAMRELDAKIVGIQRRDSEGFLYQAPGIDYSHGSEIHIPQIVERADVVIQNDGSLERYQSEARTVARDVVGG